MDERHTLSALTMQLALAGDLCALVYLFTLRSGEVGRYYPLVLLAYAPAIYGLDRLFLRSSRTMRGLILLNGVMGIGLFLSVCMVDGWKSWETMIFAGAFCLWPTVQAGKIALEPPKLHSMILCLDTSTIVLALFVSFLSAVGLPAYWSVPAAAGCAAAVLGTISLRINRSMGPRDWGVVLLAFGALFAGMLLAVRFVAAPAGEGIMALWHGAVGLVQLLLQLLLRFLMFLATLFEPAEYGELSLMEPLQVPAQEQLMEEGSPLALVIAIALCLAVLLCLAVYVLYRLGKLRIGGKKANKTGRRQCQRISLWKAVRRLMAALGARLRLRVFLWRVRNTPRGLFCLLVHRCRMGPWHKRPEETPREFLTRLQESAWDDGELSTALGELIPAVDRALYAPDCSGGPVPGARLIRRRISTAVHRQFLRDCWAKVRTLRRVPSEG